ncbi:MAG: hypothetical protein RSC92_02770 [Clostridia bacterium]
MKKLFEYLDSYEDDELELLKDELEELSSHYEEAKNKALKTGKTNKDVLYWRNKIIGVKKKIEKLNNNIVYESIEYYLRDK